MPISEVQEEPQPAVDVPARLVIQRPVQAPDISLDPTGWAQPRFAEDEAEEAEVRASGLSWLTGLGRADGLAPGRDTVQRSVFIPALLQGLAAKFTRT